jgi:site-specific recombinase XerD
MIVVENFLNYLDAREKSKNTIDSYRFDLKLWTDYQFPNQKEVTIEQLNSVTIENLYNYLASIKHKSASTRSRSQTSIKQLYNYLVVFKLIEENPAIAFKKIKQEKRHPKFLTLDQSIQLLESVDKTSGIFKERDFAILTVFMSAGLRESELIDMNIGDIEGDMLTVIGKGNKERKISLNQSCLDAINDYMKVRQDCESNALFLTKQNKRLKRQSVILIVKKYLNAIGKGNLSVHKLRHTAATEWLRSGANIRAIQCMLGHEHITTTEIYTHVQPETMREIVRNTGLANIKRIKVNN